MSELERIQRYIDSTNVNTKHYQMSLADLFALYAAFKESLSANIICLAFNYGQAKGYRAAKAEARK